MIKRTRKQAYEHWIAALKSGKYKQTRDTLRTQHSKPSFCCLGVMCDLASKDGGPKWVNREYFLGSEATLPTVVRKFMAMTVSEQGALIEMNDRGQSFEVIAEYIREKVMPKALARPEVWRPR